MALLGPREESIEGALLAGRYRIAKRLGTGGMGAVYRAVNESLGRPVAIKVLHPEMLKNAEIVERFLREARAASLVRHPNVVDVLDVLEHEGVPFIVQELLNGNDLAKYLEVCGGKLSVEEALPILIPIVEAVGVAHQKGVVHRDLKPENVFLHEVEGQVIPKVLDFGISKLTSPDAKKMTGTGLAMGTPAYMSPEQIQGSGAVDASSDVWSLGVVLFECLTGRLPFDAESPGALFVKVCTTEATRLDRVDPTLPEAVVEVVWKCLRPRREERFANATELAKALRAALAVRGVESTNKLQAISPAIIDALESKAIIGNAKAENPTKVASPSAKSDERDARDTANERPDARGNIGNHDTVAAPLEAVAARAKPRLPGGVLAVGAVVLFAAIGLAAVATARATGATNQTSDAGTHAVIASDNRAEPRADAAVAQQVRSQDPPIDDASVTVVAASTPDAAPEPPSNPAVAAVTTARRNGRNGHRPNGTASATSAAGPGNTSAAQQTGSSAANSGSSATITTTSGRRTHAATSYED